LIVGTYSKKANLSNWLINIIRTSSVQNAVQKILTKYDSCAKTPYFLCKIKIIRVFELKWL